MHLYRVAQSLCNEISEIYPVRYLRVMNDALGSIRCAECMFITACLHLFPSGIDKQTDKAFNFVVWIGSTKKDLNINCVSNLGDKEVGKTIGMFRETLKIEGFSK